MKRFRYILIGAMLVLGCKSGNGPELPLSINGAEETTVLEADPMKAVELSLSCGDDWSCYNKQEWIVVTPSSGCAGKDIKVLLTAEQNLSAKSREGIISFNAGKEQVRLKIQQNAMTPGEARRDPDDPEDNSIGEPEPNPFIPGGKPHQNPTDEAIIAWWTLGENDYMKEWNDKWDNSWIGSGWVITDWPEDCEARASWHLGTDTTTKRTYILSSDGNGHWAVKPTWEGDYLLLEIPVKELLKGDVITLRTGMSGISSVPRYWIVEWSLDGKNWTATSLKTYTVSKDSFEATVKLPGSQELYDLDESFTLSKNFSGTVSFRISITHAKYQTGGGTGTKPSDGSSIRFRPMSDAYGKQSGIAVYRNKK